MNFVSTNAIDNAKVYINQGFAVIPLERGSKGPTIKGWQNLRITADQVDDHFQPDSNIGILTGEPSGGLVDIDLDCQEAVLAAELLLPKTSMISGRGGNPRSHYWYLCSEAETNRFQCNEHGTIVEIRADRHQTLAPPSVHPSGSHYEFDLPGLPNTVVWADLYLLVSYVAAVALTARCWHNGSRQNIALHLCGTLARSHLSKADAEPLLRAICYAAGDKDISQRLTALESSYENCRNHQPVTGYPQLAEAIGEENARKVCEWLRISIASLGQSNPELHPSTDTDLAKLLAKRNANMARWTEERKCWFIFTGTHWEPDKRNQIRLFAEEIGYDLLKQAHKETDEGLQKLLMIKGKYLLDRRGKDNVINEAKAHLAITLEEMDTHPWMLNTLTGTLDLRTGKLQDHAPSDYLTKLVNIKLDDVAECPRWEQFIEEVFGSDKDLKAFIQVLSGYFLFGGNPEQKIVLLYGTGANGKSIFLSTLQALMGNYASITATETLTAKGRDNNQVASLARLKGQRLAVASETNQGVKLNESLVKSMTGGEALEARFLYGHPFTFTPEFVPVIGTNYKPELSGIDEGIWRRMLLIPCKAYIRPEDRDPDLLEKLKRELPGILNWAVTGLKHYLELKAAYGQGLRPPQVVQAATQEYRNEMDILQQFIDECCVLADSSKTTCSDLLTEYNEWRKLNGWESVTSSRLGRDISLKLNLTQKRSKSARFWVGIKLKQVTQ